MYDYLLSPCVRPEEFPHVIRQEQESGWSVEQIFQRHQMRDDEGYRPDLTEVIYDIVFKKPSKDISYGQMLVDRAHGKLKAVRDALAPLVDNPNASAIGRIAADIDKFLFQGSPEDM